MTVVIVLERVVVIVPERVAVIVECVGFILLASASEGG